MKILVVDDDPTLAHTIQQTLTDHEVLGERDPSTAVERALDADVGGDPFGVVLWNYRMPPIQGLDVRASLESLKAPALFVLLSGYDTVVEAASGADYTLLEPLSATELRTLIDYITMARSRAPTRRIRMLAPA